MMETIAGFARLFEDPDALINALGFFLLGLGAGLLVEQCCARLERRAVAKEKRLRNVYYRIKAAVARTGRARTGDG